MRASGHCRIASWRCSASRMPSVHYRAPPRTRCRERAVCPDIVRAIRMITKEDIRDLVDVAGGSASRRVFVDEDVYQREQEQVFGRAWLFLGHESQIPNPNDYYVTRMGEEEVILTRTAQGQVCALLNSCTHRGMKLCRYDQGNTRVFTCPYHAWSFATDGEFYGIPGYAERYHEELDKCKWGLARVPSVTVYAGTIWGSWDPSAPPLEEYLGGMRMWLDFALDYRDGRPNGAEVLVGVQKWRTRCNWKFAPTNFIGDVA